MNNNPLIKQSIPLNDRRFIVGWELVGVNGHTRTNVFVVDKLNHKIVYKVNTKDRLKTYPAIQRMYGKEDCIPPKPLKMAIFE